MCGNIPIVGGALMYWFLTSFFLIYGGVHLYAFLKWKFAFTPGPLATIITTLFLVVMIAAPVLIRVMEKGGHTSAARCLAYVGYTWMGILFLFFSVSLVLECARLGLIALRHFSGTRFHGSFLSGRAAFLIPLAVAIFSTGYGFYEGNHIVIEHIKVKSKKISKEDAPIRIVQISDLHLGLIERKWKLEKVIKLISKEKPDLLVSTGDLVDGQMYDMDELARLFSRVHTRLGKYAVTGNHEFYAGIHQAINFTEKCGFILLRGEERKGIINVVGIDDPVGRYYGLNKEMKEEDLLAGLPDDRFTLLLKHRPLIDSHGVKRADLQLSGHTHKGQIFPFNILTRYFYPRDSGLYAVSGTLLYVSRGTGTWGPPIRILSPPEITVITLEHEGN